MKPISIKFGISILWIVNVIEKKFLLILFHFQHRLEDCEHTAISRGLERFRQIPSVAQSSWHLLTKTLFH